MKMRSITLISILSIGLLGAIPTYASDGKSIIKLEVNNMSCNSIFALRLAGQSSSLEHLFFKSFRNDGIGETSPTPYITSSGNTLRISLEGSCTTQNMSITLKATYPQNVQMLEFQTESPYGSESQITVNGNNVVLNNNGTTVVHVPVMR